MKNQEAKRKKSHFFVKPELLFREDGTVNREALESQFAFLLEQKDKNEAFGVFFAEVGKALKKKGRSKETLELLSLLTDLSEKAGLEQVPMSPALVHLLINGDGEKKPPRSERKSDLDKKKTTIFNASIRVFSRKGYHGATMEEIAAVSGIGKGSIYRYFKSKEDLLRQLLTAKYGEILERFVLIFERDENVLLQIQEMIEIWIEFIEENYLVYNLIQNKNIQQLLGEDIMFYDFFVTHLPMLKDRIIVMNEKKKLKTTSFYTVIYGILGFIDGVAQKWLRSNRDYPLSSEIPIILEVLFNGFVGEKNTGKSFIEGQ